MQKLQKLKYCHLVPIVTTKMSAGLQNLGHQSCLEATFLEVWKMQISVFSIYALSAYACCLVPGSPCQGIDYKNKFNFTIVGIIFSLYASVFKISKMIFTTKNIFLKVVFLVWGIFLEMCIFLYKFIFALLF